MDNGLGHFLQLALAVLALTAIAGLGALRATVTNLREQLGDARGEIADKERRMSEMEQDIIKLRARVNSQEKDLVAVGRLIRGESYWTELGEKLDAHHEEALIHWRADEDKLDAILAALERNGIH